MLLILHDFAVHVWTYFINLFSSLWFFWAGTLRTWSDLPRPICGWHFWVNLSDLEEFAIWSPLRVLEFRGMCHCLRRWCCSQSAVEVRRDILTKLWDGSAFRLSSIVYLPKVWTCFVVIVEMDGGVSPELVHWWWSSSKFYIQLSTKSEVDWDLQVDLSHLAFLAAPCCRKCTSICISTSLCRSRGVCMIQPSPAESLLFRWLEVWLL